MLWGILYVASIVFCLVGAVDAGLLQAQLENAEENWRMNLLFLANKVFSALVLFAIQIPLLEQLWKMVVPIPGMLGDLSYFTLALLPILTVLQLILNRLSNRMQATAYGVRLAWWTYVKSLFPISTISAYYEAVFEGIIPTPYVWTRVLLIVITALFGIAPLLLLKAIRLKVYHDMV